MRATLDSVLERATGRPRLVRDRVLRASSPDGLTWTRDDRRPITHTSHRRPHMTYFTGHDQRGRLWVRASVQDGDAWHTEMTHGPEWHDVRTAGVDHLYAPTWVRDGVYGVAKPLGGGPGYPARFAQGEDGEPVRAEPQAWEGIDGFAIVEDLCIIERDGRLLAFVSVGNSRRSIAIHRWESADGTACTHQGLEIESPYYTPYHLDINPSVVTLDDGTFRAYFRTGERAVLGNHIRSAVSDDLASWRHEDGTRIAPGGRWDSHGLGFPHVWRDGDGWRMLYAGYWGDTPAADSTREFWEREAQVIESE